MNAHVKRVSDSYFDCCVIHEIEEFKEMRKGTKYWHAHQKAIKKEKDFRKSKKIKKKFLTKV